MTLTPAEKVSKGIIELQREQPFYAMLTMRMRIQEWSDEMRAALLASGLKATAGVNPKGDLFYAPEFIDSLSGGEVQGLLCHEVLHVALLHFLRTGNRNKIVSNMAQDCVVNMSVIRAGMLLPSAAGGINYDSYRDACAVPLGFASYTVKKVSERTWEDIYDELMQVYDDNKQQVPEYAGFDVHIRDSDGGATADEISKEWAGAMVEAATYAKKIGKLPAGMERFIDGLLKPKVSWKDELLQYIKPMLSPVDFSYRRPNRKSMVLGVFLPDVEREYLNVEVLVDTSGSMNDDDLQAFLSEVVAISSSHQHVNMHITFCDAEVHGRYEISNGDIPKIFAQKCKGGGGTILENGLDDIDKNGDEVSVVLTFTDGYNNFKYSKNPYPFEVVWVVSSNGTTQIPYGRVISMRRKR